MSCHSLALSVFPAGEMEIFLDPVLSRRILLVDDEADFIEPVAYWLRSKGYDVEMAGDGEAALQTIAERRPDIVFLDINMPRLGGLEALKTIREHDPDLPVVLLTAAYGDEDKIRRARELGVSGFFAKSYTFEQLTQVLQATLKTHRSLRDPSQEEKKDT